MSTSSNFNFTTNELTTKGIVCLENQSFNDQELLELAHTLSSRKDKALLEWDFGPIMEMKFSASAKNYLFSEEEVPFHWDGAFLKEPKYLIFFYSFIFFKIGHENISVNRRCFNITIKRIFSKNSVKIKSIVNV